MGTTSYRWLGVLVVFACGACSRADEPELDIRGVSDVDASDGVVAPAPDVAAQWPEERMFHSGGRLRARVLDGGGDALVFQGFRDTALDVDCAYELAEDGVQRCLPANGADWVYYLDPQCSEAVWYGFPEGDRCEAPESPFALDGLPPNTECQEAFRTRVYRIGAPLPAATVYTVGSEGCRAVDAPTCLREVERVAPEQFLRGQTRVEAVEGGVSIHWIEFDDGARYIRGLADAERGLQCSVEPELVGARCVPTSTAHVFLDGVHGSSPFFADASCGGSHAALDFAREACERADMGIVWRKKTCERYEYTLYEIGDELTRAYQWNEASCAAVDATQGSWFYELGAKLEIETLPEVQRVRAGSGRLRASYFASAAGRPLQVDGQFYDEQLERTCAAQRMADDTLRCAPWAPDAFLEPQGPFADADCARQLVMVATRADGCTRVPEVAVRSGPQRSRPGAFYDVGARFEPTGGVIYMKVGDECRQRAVADGENYYVLEPKLELAVVTERID